MRNNFKLLFFIASNDACQQKKKNLKLEIDSNFHMLFLPGEKWEIISMHEKKIISDDDGRFFWVKKAVMISIFFTFNF